MENKKTKNSTQKSNHKKNKLLDVDKQSTDTGKKADNGQAKLEESEKKEECYKIRQEYETQLDKFTDYGRKFVFSVLAIIWVLVYHDNSFHGIESTFIIAAFSCFLYLFLDIIDVFRNIASKYYLIKKIEKGKLNRDTLKVESDSFNSFQYFLFFLKIFVFVAGAFFFSSGLVKEVCYSNKEKHTNFQNSPTVNINAVESSNTDLTEKQNVEFNSKSSMMNKDTIKMIERKRTDAQFVQGKEK